ncbi:MAG: hypothetical protein IPM97_03210 [Bdellovibrionaceae bacterium]|nr:hypothetical protein [Pseudobdellovibrionaceae bacterium]
MLGPGVRFATANNSAATAEAGVIFKLLEIQIGGGARYLSYFVSREDVAETVLPKMRPHPTLRPCRWWQLLVARCGSLGGLGLRPKVSVSF